MNRLMLIAAIAMAGFLGTLGLTFGPSGESASCPMLGAVPACVFVLGGYGAMFASTLFTGWRAAAAFLSSCIITLSVSVSGLLSGLSGAAAGAPALGLLLASLLSTAAVVTLGAIWARPYLCRPARSLR